MKKKRIKHRKRRTMSCEHRSDQRTAEFIMRRIEQIQEDLSDLFADFRTFDHYSEIEDVGSMLRVLQNLKRKYDRFATRGLWD